MYMLVIYLCADEVLSVCARVCDETETQIKKNCLRFVLCFHTYMVIGSGISGKKM